MRAEDWTPPEDPDPQAILQEAQADTRAKRYDTALAKHVWFHEHALEINPAFYGVRLSFALGGWNDLAQRHAPALAKLIETRDAHEKDVMAGKLVHESFHSMAAINKYLDESVTTKEIFKHLDQENPEAAKKVFGIAQPALIEAKAYALMGKYLSPEADFRLVKRSYEQGKKIAANPRFGADHLDFAQKHFANKSTTLVAILVINGREEEAEKIAAAARAEWDDESFHRALQDALDGVVPKPWP